MIEGFPCAARTVAFDDPREKVEPALDIGVCVAVAIGGIAVAVGTGTGVTVGVTDAPEMLTMIVITRDDLDPVSLRTSTVM